MRRPGSSIGTGFTDQWIPSAGMRFDSGKVLLDPYGRGVAVTKSYSREAARENGDNTAFAMKNAVVDSRL